jgi:shikimate kinase
MQLTNKSQNIFLIGMMGSGKSSIAPLLSKKLNVSYVDTDKDLISIFDETIEDVFSKLTEHKFRILESTYFIEHTKQKQHIYATGGGIILKKGNRKILKNGFTILLDTPINVILKRLQSNKSKHRPLFKYGQTLNELKKLWLQRKKYYHECSNIIINTEFKTIDEIVLEIIKAIK